LVLDLRRPRAPKSTPEDFFNAFMDHHAEAGTRVSKDAVVELMLKHATWLAVAAKQYVDVQSWKEFAKTKVLDVDEELDVEMDEPEHERLVRLIPGSPATLTLSPKRKRVRPRAQPQMHYLLNTITLTVTERQFPVLPRIRFGRSILRMRIRTWIQSGTLTITTPNQPLRRSACAHDVPICT
jgi:hypothetical protein